MGNLDSHNDSDIDSDDIDSNIGVGMLGVQLGHNWTEEDRVCCGLANMTTTRREITGLSQLMQDRFKTEAIKLVMKAIPREHFVYNTGAKIQSVYYNLDNMPNEEDTERNHVCFAPCREVHNNSTYVRILESLQLRPGHSFLHLGSGTGYLSTLAGVLIGGSGVNHGVEVNPEMLAYAEERQKALRDHCQSLENFEYCEPTFVLGDCLKLDPTPQYYDRIYCSGMLPQGYDNVLRRCLKIDGVMIYPRDCRTFVKISRDNEDTYTVEVERANLRVYPFMSNDNEGFSALPEKNFPTLQELSRAAVRTQVRKSLFVQREKSSQNSKRKSDTDEVPEVEEPNHQNKKLKVDSTPEGSGEEAENSNLHEMNNKADYINLCGSVGHEIPSNAFQIRRTEVLDNIETNTTPLVDDIRDLLIGAQQQEQIASNSSNGACFIQDNNISDNPEVSNENIQSTVTISTTIDENNKINEPSNSSNYLDKNNYGNRSISFPIPMEASLSSNDDENHSDIEPSENEEGHDSEYTTIDEDSDSDPMSIHRVQEVMNRLENPLRFMFNRPAGDSSDNDSQNSGWEEDDESNIEDDSDDDDDDDFFIENDYCEYCHLKINEAVPKEVKTFNPNEEYDMNTLYGKINLLPLPKDIKLYLKYKNNLISM